MKTLPSVLFAAIALVPALLLAVLVDAGAPGNLAGAAVPTDRWVHLGLVATSSLALFLAFRVRSAGVGAGLLAAFTWALFPSVVDAIASPHAREALVLATASAILLALLALILRRREGAARLALFFVVIASGAVALGLRWSGADRGAHALQPLVAAGLLAAVSVGQAWREVALRRPGEPWLRACVGLVVVLLSAEAFLAQRTVESWESPSTFWERVCDEEPGSPAALGARAYHRIESGDRAAATRDLNSLVMAVEAGGGSQLSGEGARRMAALGAAEAAAAILRAEDALPEERATAESALEAARILQPEGAEVLTVLGEARLRAGEVEEALQLLRNAVDRDPASARAWNGLARVLLGRPAMREALQAARQATGLEPQNPRYVVTLAWAFHYNQLDADALFSLNGALGSPPDIDVAQALATISHRVALQEISAGRTNRARRLLKHALRVFPFDDEAGALLQRLDADMAEERVTMEAKFRPREGEQALPDNVIVWAAWLCRWGEYEEARPWFASLERSLPGNAQLLFLVGQEFWENRLTTEGLRRAVEYYRKAIAVDPSHVEAHNRLWQALRLLGEPEQARAAAGRFLELAPGHPDSLMAERLLR